MILGAIYIAIPSKTHLTLFKKLKQFTMKVFVTGATGILGRIIVLELLKKGKTDEALQTLKIINPDNAQEMLNAIQTTDNQSVKGTNLAEFFSGKYNFPIWLAFLFAFFNQFPINS